MVFGPRAKKKADSTAVFGPLSLKMLTVLQFWPTQPGGGRQEGAEHANTRTREQNRGGARRARRSTMGTDGGKKADSTMVFGPRAQKKLTVLHFFGH